MSGWQGFMEFDVFNKFISLFRNMKFIIIQLYSLYSLFLFFSTERLAEDSNPSISKSPAATEGLAPKVTSEVTVNVMILKEILLVDGVWNKT